MGREDGDQDTQKRAIGANENMEKSNLLVVKETQNNVTFQNLSNQRESSNCMIISTGESKGKFYLLMVTCKTLVTRGETNGTTFSLLCFAVPVQRQAASPLLGMDYLPLGD